MNMKKVSTLILALLLCACFVLPAAAATEERNAVVSVELAGERNVAGDSAPIAGGWAGTAVTIGEKDIVLTHVGRMYFTGSSLTHCYMVVNTDGSIVMDYSRLDSQPEDAVDGKFLYYTLPTPITLTAGQTYYFVSDFWGPEDRFYDSSVVVSSEDVSFVGKVSLNVAGGWDMIEAANIDNLPLDFKYTVEVEDETGNPGNSDVEDNGKDDDKLPSTGDELPVAALAAILCVSCAAFVVLNRKKSF